MIPRARENSAVVMKFTQIDVEPSSTVVPTVEMVASYGPILLETIFLWATAKLKSPM